MPALIDLRRRIKSIRNTQQITQAMKTVATAKFKKSQRHVLESRPYWHSSPDFMAKLVLWAKKRGHPLLAERDEKKVEGVVLTSDKGLAGAFSSNLPADALAFFKEKAQGNRIPGINRIFNGEPHASAGNFPQNYSTIYSKEDAKLISKIADLIANSGFNFPKLNHLQRLMKK